MEILPLQQKYMSNSNKNIIFIEANVMDISVKFQLHPPYGFWGEDFWIVFRKFSRLDKIHIVGRDYLRNISVKLLSKYLQWDSNKCQFPLFPL